MKKLSILLLLVVLVGAVVISFAQNAPGEKPTANRELAEMRNQLNELRAKIQTLEDRMKGLESTVDQLKRPHLQPLTSPGQKFFWTPPAASESGPPKIWGEREINGWTFYIVPCGDQTHAQGQSRIAEPSGR